MLGSLLQVLLAMPTDNHAFYLSVVEVAQESNRRATVRVKVFSDDLQDVLRNFADESGLKLDTKMTSSNDLLAKYFNKHLQLKVNEQSLVLALDKVVIENDATFLTFDAARQQVEWLSIDIHAPYFTELFPAQINTFKIATDGQVYYGKTSKGAPSYRINLN